MARNRSNNIIGFFLVAGPALFFILLVLFMSRRCEHKFEVLDDYGQIKPFEFNDITGKTRNSSEFEGDLLLITTIQNTCPDSCAILMWHTNQMIYQHIWKNRTKKLKQVKILSFVTDGKGNQVSDLTKIHEKFKARVENYDPELWILASGDAKSVYNIENNGQTLLQKGKEYFGGEGFQELMLLLDKKQHLRMVLSGKQEGHIRRMKQSIALLQKQYDKYNAEKNK